MTKTLRSLCAALVATLLVGCASTQLVAVSDYDTAYDFERVRRLAILPIDRTTAAEKLISDMQVSRINAALTDELVSRGYAVVENPADAELYLSWHLVTREKTDVRAYDAATSYTCFRCGPPVSDLSVRQFTEGAFIVDFIDPLKGKSVWRSTIQSRLHAQPDPEVAATNRAKAATAVLAPFPPAPMSRSN